MLDKIIRDLSISTATNYATMMSHVANFISTILPDSSLEEFSDPRQQEAKQLLQDGIVKLENNQFRAASQSLEAALQIYREIGDRSRETKTRIYITIVSLYVEEPHQQLENIISTILACPDFNIFLKESPHFFAELLRYIPQLEKYSEEIFQLMQQGKKQVHYSQFIDALKTLEQGLNLALEINHPMWITVSSNNIGEVYRQQGQYLLAKNNFERAREHSKKISKERLFFKGMILNNLGGISYHLGKYSKAQKFLEDALAIHRQIGN
ncbi:MAG TPA: hypothetical protein DCY88_30350, partial [Cyanobacteria bacterium UBA11372]|nr:hypothetical protein [Cyanobacteria bacterium UBA11372]